MATFWDEGLETSIYHLEQVAATLTTDATFTTRAKALETRLKNQWFPIVESISIKGDALELGYDLAAATNTGTVGSDSSKPNVLFDQDTTIGGKVGTDAQELAVGGDVTQNALEFGQDVTKSAQQLANTLHLPNLPTVASYATKFLYLLAGLLVLLAVLYVYERGKA